MNQRDMERALEREIEEWPGVTVEFAMGGKHPKAKFTYAGNMLSRPFSGTPGDSIFGVHAMLGDMRRVMRQLGATRTKPEPSEEEDEAPYRKPNDGAEKRQDPPRQKAEPEQSLRAKASAAGLDVRETINVPGEGESEDEADFVERRAALQAAIDGIADGIYFGLDETIYHAVPALGGSSICQLGISPATFWRGSWLDPDRPELDEEQTIAQLLGKAYHAARLEPDTFEQRFCCALDKADFPGALTSDTAVKAELKEYGATQSIAGEGVLERAFRLRDMGYDGTIWAIEKAHWESALDGRAPIAAKYWKDILIDMERIRGVPDVSKLLTGGAAEVSIFWTDDNGLRCKARFDYLTGEHWGEFKTFANSQGKHVNQAITDAIRYNRYYIAAGHYRDAAEAVRLGELDILGPSTDDQRALIAQIKARESSLACWFVFQEKGGVPNLFAREFMFFQGLVSDAAIAQLEADGANEEHLERARNFQKIANTEPSRTQIYRRAQTEIAQAKELFMTYSQVYDPGEPWAPLDPIGTIDDADFSPYFLEGRA